MKRLYAVCFLLLLPACITGTLVKPEVELENVRVTDPNLTAATFVFDLRVTNPNRVRLSLNTLQYQLDLNEKEFATGDLQPKATIGAGEKQTVSLPVRVSYFKLYESLKTLAQSGKVQYRIKGAASVSGFGVPFDFGGKLKLPK